MITNGTSLLYNARGLPWSAYGEQDARTLNQATRLLQVLGAIASRSSIAGRLGKSFSDDRDLYTALGYNKTLRYEDYYARYDRQDIAKAVTDRPVKDSWRKDPTVTDGNPESPFSRAWRELAKERRVYHYLQRLDIIASLGRYGILVLGLDDLQANETPEKEATRAKNLLFLAPHTELSATITAWDRRPSSPRHGLPVSYSVSTSIDTESGVGGILIPSSQSDVVSWYDTQHVHYSRVLHVVEDPLDSDVFGQPCLRAIFNRLEDLEKIVGGAGEMFWRGARKEMALIADKEANLGPQTLAAVKDEVEAFIHEAQTFLRLQGMDVKTIAPAIADPRSHVDVALDLISAARRIPKSILIGAAQGELASAEMNFQIWALECEGRRLKHNEPMILRPFIDRMIALGILEAPAQGEYEVVWPDLLTPSDKDKAEVSQKLSAALDSYAKARKNGLILPFEVYLREILGWGQKQMEVAEEVAGRSFREIEEEAKAEAKRPEIAKEVAPEQLERKEDQAA